MTKQEILESENEYLTPAQVAAILHCDPQLIRTAAKSGKCDILGFKVLMIGHAAKIPRDAFARAMGWIA